MQGKEVVQKICCFEKGEILTFFIQLNSIYLHLFNNKQKKAILFNFLNSLNDFS